MYNIAKYFRPNVCNIALHRPWLWKIWDSNPLFGLRVASLRPGQAGSDTIMFAYYRNIVLLYNCVHSCWLVLHNTQNFCTHSPHRGGEVLPNHMMNLHTRCCHHSFAWVKVVKGKWLQYCCCWWWIEELASFKLTFTIQLLKSNWEIPILVQLTIIDDNKIYWVFSS